MMKSSKRFIISIVVSAVITILLIGPHSGDEYDRAPGAILIGIIVLCIMMISGGRWPQIVWKFTLDRIRELWKFTLDRIRELSKAIQGK